MIQRKVALLIESSRTYGRGLLYGIAKYVQAHGHWTTWYHERSLGEDLPVWMKRWHGDGILARIDSAKLHEQIENLDIPVVDLRLLYESEKIPSIGIDNHAVVKLAADHFLKRRFEHFAFCGLTDVDYARRRCDFFSSYLERRGYEVNVWLESRHGLDHDTTTAIEARGLVQDVTLLEWLQSLPKPVGLMAHNDVRAKQVLMACSQGNIPVPEEVAVIGVDNDPILCELASPSLTSIQIPSQNIGYLAAVTLDGMMQGNMPKEHRRLIPPLKGIVCRQSTDVIATPDREIAKAMQFIRENACQEIGINDIVRHIGISRSTLERRFAKYFDRTPKAEIIRVQIRWIQQLLLGTDYPLTKIARMAGFKHVEYMCKLFKKHTGQTPNKYRKSTH